MDKPKHVSAGEVFSPHDLRTEIIVANADGKVIYRQAGSLFGETGIPVNLNQPGDPIPDFQWKSWSHTWHCGPFNTCSSLLDWAAYVLDKRNNQKMAWDLVEVAAINADIPITPTNMDQQPCYKQITPQTLNPNHPPALTDFGLNWPKNGKDVVFYTAARCHLNNLATWFWTFRSQA